MITRESILNYVKSNYLTNPEKTFSKFPNYCVLRHNHNDKWYGLIMNVSKSKLGLKGTGDTDVIDLKIEPELLGSFLGKEGYYPAYHMNKENWITIDLNSNVSFKEVEEMIDNSYKMTY
ncbi:hypothetical protein ATZ33_11935 [Enterococcus silesiacus]|uniref:MmcQ family protein n=1 Tax=Enterococcus silesiacus TaxID=332949 RepID=A0A0S3KCN3_9ENTE|nr:MmcQ/YjbR family DNA-binding protein [Enterococcus silesiacus]ALS02067.1 hypothetical protein ATZ33_11935 [Enterococcus silesiacus]OJG91568.1 hypothetical protein RV15_GL000654 [Enterococcus silesiacus]